MKRLVNSLVGFFLLCVTPLAFASETTSSTLFSVKPTDISWINLGHIFGPVGNTLGTASPSFLGAMFGILNQGILVIAVFVLMYTIIVATINTAGQGEMMGQRFSSVWIPLRSAFGLILIVPAGLGKIAGYSMIQVIIMWICVNGIGLADHVWEAGLNAANSSLHADHFHVSPKNQAPSKIYEGMSGMLQGEACMYAVRKQLLSNDPDAASYGITQIVDDKGKLIGLNFGWDASNAPANKPNFVNLCGNVTWATPKVKNHKNSGDKYNQFVTAVNADRAALLTTMANSMEPLAEQIVSGDVSMDELTKAHYDVLKTATETYYNQLNQSIQQDFQAAYGGDTGINDPGWMKNAIARGWMTAGSFYRYVTTSNNNIQAATSQGFSYSTIGSQLPTVDPSGSVKQYLGDSIDRFVAQVADYADESDNSNPHTGPDRTSVGGKNFMKAFGNHGLSNLIHDFTKDMASGKHDIIISLQSYGNRLMDAIIPVGIATFIGIIILLSVVEGETLGVLGATGQMAALVFLGFIFIILGAIFMIAMSLAYYIPMIPFIIFSLATAGWFIAVIEAMIAGPLIALGILYPEGHDILGKAENALMVIGNMFLRPALMIFGLFAAILLSNVIVGYVATVYSGVVDELISTSHNAFVGTGMLLFSLFIPMIAFMAIFTGLATTLLNMCFGMINQIPDRIMRFIGGQMEQFGGAEQEQKVQQAFQQAGGQIHRGGSVAIGAAAWGTKGKIEEGARERKAEAKANKQAAAAATAAGSDKPEGGGSGGGGSGGGGSGGGGSGGGGSGGGGSGGGGSGGSGAASPAATGGTSTPPPG